MGVFSASTSRVCVAGANGVYGASCTGCCYIVGRTRPVWAYHEGSQRSQGCLSTFPCVLPYRFHLISWLISNLIQLFFFFFCKADDAGQVLFMEDSSLWAPVDAMLVLQRPRARLRLGLAALRPFPILGTSQKKFTLTGHILACVAFRLYNRWNSPFGY